MSGPVVSQGPVPLHSSRVGLLGVALPLSVASVTVCLGQSIKVWGVVGFSACMWVLTWTRELWLGSTVSV